MVKYIVYDINNEEPLKVSSTLMQSDNEYSRSYITGAEIRGSYIANYIKLKGVENIDSGVHREKLLNGGIEFYNAYPVINGRRAYPFPKCFIAYKDDIKRYRKSKRMKITVCCQDNGEDDFDRVRGFEFVNFDFDKNVLETRSIDKINSLHINKMPKENKLFRYEAINKGESFRGIIKCKDENFANEVKYILENGLFYIGGSKGTGYGKCTVKNISIKDYNPDFKYFNDEFDFDDDFFNNENVFCIYATSDILYRDKYGIYRSYVDEEYLKEKLNLEEVKFKNSFIEMEYFTGFNNKWGCRLPIVNGIKSGSILVYSFKGNMKLKNIKSLEEEGIGERKQDGFGNIMIFSDFESDISFDELTSIKNNDIEIKEKILKNDDKDQFQIILDRIYFNKLNEMLPKKVLELDEQMQSPLKSNQFGKLMNLMDLLLGMKYKEGIKKLEGYFEHISDMKLNRELPNNIDKSFIGRKHLKDYTIEEIKDVDMQNFSNRYCQTIKIGGVESKLKDETQMIYEYKVRMFKELFRLQLKQDKKGGRN